MLTVHLSKCINLYKYENDIIAFFFIVIFIIIVPVLCIAYQGGYTALTTASEKGHKDVVKLLLDHGANKNLQDKKVRIIYVVSCMYVCMYVWMDGWMDGCMYICICRHVRMHACIHAGMHA